MHREYCSDAYSRANHAGHNATRVDSVSDNCDYTIAQRGRSYVDADALGVSAATDVIPVAFSDWHPVRDAHPALYLGNARYQMDQPARSERPRRLI